jgi:DNA repair protein RadA
MATRTLLEGGLDGYVVVVDTENTFRASRVAEIALKRGYDVNDTLSKIKHIDATSSSYQIVVMDKIREFAREHPVKLLIIDSVISHFRSEYIGRGALAERQQLLNGYLADLLRFAKNNDAVVLMTNQMSMRPDAMMFVDPAEAVGGNILGHASAVRLLIRRGKAGKRVIKLEKCPFLPNGECVATLNEKGICDD